MTRQTAGQTVQHDQQDVELEMKHAPNIVQPLNIVQRGMSNGPVLLGSTVLDAIK